MSSLSKTNSAITSFSCTSVFATRIVKIFLLSLLVVPFAFLSTSKFEPSQTGFFCDDNHLKYPYLTETVSSEVCLVIWIVLTMLVICTVEVVMSSAERNSNAGQSNAAERRAVSSNLLYSHIGCFILGLMSCLLVSEFAKYYIAKLRPYYLTLCMPVFTKDLCLDQYGYHKFIEQEEETICQGLKNNITSKQTLDEAKLAFISEHSCVSFFCAIFIMFYLHERVKSFRPINKSLRKTKLALYIITFVTPLFGCAVSCLAFWISFTRIKNYHNSTIDVVLGAFVGIFFDVITALNINNGIFTNKIDFDEEKNDDVDDWVGEI